MSQNQRPETTSAEEDGMSHALTCIVTFDATSGEGVRVAALGRDSPDSEFLPSESSGVVTQALA